MVALLSFVLLLKECVKASSCSGFYSKIAKSVETGCGVSSLSVGIAGAEIRKLNGIHAMSIMLVLQLSFGRKEIDLESNFRPAEIIVGICTKALVPATCSCACPQYLFWGGSSSYCLLS